MQRQRILCSENWQLGFSAAGVTGFLPLKDDEFLLRFLRAKKFDVNEAFDALKTYYKFKFEYSGVLTDFVPTDFRTVFEMDKIFISPKRTPIGEGIFIVFPGIVSLVLNDVKVVTLFSVVLFTHTYA
ncbi:hypothetical protein AVEN_122948-1 [Araneus ventricosus]|uniref:CRAL/TRIO N-terminal domain-containing protein n=1 Tax=Araneus ventricosus TaxID=182803 RepID=A0A4Y2V4P0_ARAVE|nr:hypothetical protein AVEN_122948-1 [Araneus ventricosus]